MITFTEGIIVIALPLESVVTPLPSVLETAGSIPHSAVRFFYNWELFHAMFLFCLASFILCLVLALEEVPVLCWPQVRGDSPVMSNYQLWSIEPS